MILYKYLFKEIFKVQIVVLLVLFFVFITQVVIKLVSRASVGRIPANIVSELIAYSIPEILSLMLPLTLFTAIIIALGRVSSDSEMVVMRSVGFSASNIMVICLALSAITSGVAAINGIWLYPWANKAQDSLIAEAENSPTFIPIEKAKFLSVGRYTIYIDDLQGTNNSKIQELYVFENPFYPPSSAVTVAKEGSIENRIDGYRAIHLKEGKRYQGPNLDEEFRIATFDSFEAPILVNKPDEVDVDDISSIPTKELLLSSDPKHQAEVQWRLAPAFAIFVLSLVAVPLSMVNPRQGRFARFVPAILIYASYYMCLLSVKNMINSQSIAFFPGLYLVPIMYLLLVVIPLNLPKSYVGRIYTIFRKK